MDCKVKVNNHIESSRVKRAFSAIGGDANGRIAPIDFDFNRETNVPEFAVALIENQVYSCIYPSTFYGWWAEEITLPELEKLAANHLLANSPEFQYGEPGDCETPPPVSERLKKYQEKMSKLDEKNAELRYLAAIESLNKGSKFPGTTTIWYGHDSVMEAIKIAVGIAE